MRVVIVGAGQVGTSIAADLAADHEIILVDADADRIEEVKYNLDAMTVIGDGTSLTTLENAGVAEADMVIASTDDDRVNLVVCETASTIGDPFTIARTKQAKYLDTWERDQGAFGVDLMVCSDLRAAEDIVRVVGLPAAIDVEPFADGLVNMAEFEIDADSPISGQSIADADRFDQLTFVGLFRDDDVILPQGETVIETGDRAVVIGTPTSVQAFADDITPAATLNDTDNVVIIGGTQIGYHAARLLEEQGISPQLVEENADRARQVAEDLPETLVLETDMADTEFLSRGYIEDADVLIAARDNDGENLLASMLARRVGTDRIIAVVDNSDYVALFEEIGIDAAINPRDVTAEEIIRLTHRTVAENLSVLENDQATVLELELDNDSDIVGRSIQQVTDAFDGRIIFGAIIRDETVITPRGGTTLQSGDRIVVFVESRLVDRVTAKV